MQIIVILLGILAFFVAWALIFNPRLIFKFNAWMRDYVFSDQLALFSGKRLAFLFLILGIISLFSGIELVTRSEPISSQVAAKILNQAQIEFTEEKYQKVIFKCNELVKSDPSNLAAKELLAGAYIASDQKEKGKGLLREIIEQKPDYRITSGPVAKYFKQLKDEESAGK